MAIEKVINITVNSEGATASVVKLDNAIENTTSSVEDLTVAQKKLNTSSKGLSTQMVRGTTPALTSFSQVIQDAPFGIRGVANNIQQLTAQFGHLSANAGGAKGALKAMVGGLVGPAGILLAVSVVTSLMVSFGDKIFSNTKKIEKQEDAWDDLNDSLKDNVKLVEKQIELAKVQGKETDELERKRTLELLSRKEAIITQIGLLEVALKADQEAATKLSFWDKWFGSGDESRNIDEEERSRLNKAISTLQKLRQELGTVNIAIEKALLGDEVELETDTEEVSAKNPVTGLTTEQLGIVVDEQNQIVFEAVDAEFFHKKTAEEQWASDKRAILKRSAEEEKAINKQTALFVMGSAVDVAFALESLAGENTELAKAAGIAGVIIDGTAAIISTWAGYGSMAFVGTSAAIAQSVAITAMMVASVGKIKQVQKPTRGGSQSVGSAVTQPQAPQFNVVGTSDTNQLADTINTQTPVRAYVVSSEVTSQQELDRNIQSNASFG